MAYNAPIEDAFDPTTQDYNIGTLPWDEIIKQAIQAQLQLTRVMIPGKVIKVISDQTADIQPLFQSRALDGTMSNLPIIHNCPVSMLQGSDFFIKVPFAVGDTGWILCADRSMDAWLASDGGIVDPADSRQHELTDGIFFPGLVPTGKQTTDGSTDLVVKNGLSTMRVKKDGSFNYTNGLMSATFDKTGAFTFTNGVMTAKFNAEGTFSFSNGALEVMDLLVQLSSQVQTLSLTLSTDTVNTPAGPMPLNAFAEYANIAAAVQILMLKLTVLKG